MEDRFFRRCQRKMEDMALPWDSAEEPSSARRKCHGLDTRGRSFFRVCQRRSISFSRKMVLPWTPAEEPYLPSSAGIRGRKVLLRECFFFLRKNLLPRVPVFIEFFIFLNYSRTIFCSYYYLVCFIYICICMSKLILYLV